MGDWGCSTDELKFCTTLLEPMLSNRSHGKAPYLEIRSKVTPLAQS